MIDQFHLNQVLEAMQSMDELGGPEASDYIDTMNAISAIAASRAHAARAHAARFSASTAAED